MVSLIDSRISVRLFIGCLATSEIKLLLDKSHRWKEANIMRQGGAKNLTLLPHEGKDFLGLFAEESELSLSEIEDLGKLIRREFQDYCPSYDTDKIKIVLFPQVFIS